MLAPVLFKSIALAAALTLGTGTASALTMAPATKTTEVRFAKGATQATYRGKLRGAQVHAYRFHARKGQTLNVDWERSAQHIDVAVVQYAAVAPDETLIPIDQVLPSTGTYEVRVLQTRNGVRINGNKWRPYALTIRITNEGKPVAAVPAEMHGTQLAATRQPWLNYRCSNGRTVQARYAFGEATASVQVKKADGSTVMMDYSDQSTRDQMVFQGGGHTWSLDQTRPGQPGARNGFLYRNTTSTLDGKKVPVEEIVVKNCNLVR